MSISKIIGIIFLLLLCNCSETKKNNSTEQNLLSSENKDVIIKIKTLTICKNVENDSKIPTFLFYMQLVNKTTDKFVFFVQNFEENFYKGGFFLNFVNNNKDVVIELADFSSTNQMKILDKDTLKLMITSVTDENSDIIWNEKEKQNFLETMKIIYYPEIKEIQKDTSLINYRILQSNIIIADEKTRIFD